jgi:hypothetical protein
VDGKYPYIRKVINRGGDILGFPETVQLSELLSDDVNINPFGAPTSVQKFMLGTKLTRGERVWRYARASGALTTGMCLCAAPASHADADDDIAMTVPAATPATLGTYAVSITGTTNIAVAANYYKEGYLITNDNTGQGHLYKIKSHPAIANGTQCIITLYDPLVETLDATTQVGLRKNPYDGVAVSTATTPVAMPAGIAPQAVTDTYYFWMQTGGPAPCNAKASINVGTQVAIGKTAGQADPTAHDGTLGSTIGTQQVIGWAMTPAAADGEFFMVFLTLDR